MNRLSQEKSPYLLQHASNPVDWYAWGEEAFRAAKDQNKPIFLSIGYSTCHWCHVMAHESFEDASTAEVMNKYFINVKVDREERPDVDHLYMTTVQLITGSGGWPMSVWLTPELKPFYGGTYFPPDEKHGRPGFKTLLHEIAQIWANDKDRAVASAVQITDAVKEALHSISGEGPVELSSNDLSQRAFAELERNFDPSQGGFGKAPKFPMPSYLLFLLYYYSHTQSSTALKMVDLTLRKMAEGGLYDQLGGGFARYSTDPHWVVPHFEKMLYDNSQLISVYVLMNQASRDDYFKEVAMEACRYILRDMTHPDGGFYSAEDADSEGKEGTFYLWTLSELKQILGDTADAFAYRFGVTVNGNFFDPHTGEAGKNILVQAHSLEQTAKEFKRPVKEITEQLEAAKKKLIEVRSKRVRPHLDDKIITEWNGLMISALTKAGAVFGEKSYIQAAERAVSFIRSHLYDASTKTLYRRWRDGERRIEGLLGDYAFFVQALLDLFEATGTVEHLEWAGELHDEMNKKFLDGKSGGYLMSRSSDLLFQLTDDSDNVIPSGNSIAVQNGVRLGRLLAKGDWTEIARTTIGAFSRPLKLHPTGLLQMLIGLLLLEKDPPQVVVVAPPIDPAGQRLLNTAHRAFRPGKMVIPLQPGAVQDRLAKINSALGFMQMLNGQATAYVCVNFSCQEPTTDESLLARQIQN